MNAQEMLAELRKKGEIAMDYCDFVVSPIGQFANDIGQGLVKDGGPVQVSASRKQIADGNYEGVCHINVQSDDQGKDYYFPWVNRGVGFVDVPYNASEGTLVLTGGMNGCSLEVRNNNGKLTFYHDADNKYLDALLPNRPGIRVCRVEPSSYDNLDIGYKVLEKYPLMERYSYLHQLLCVKHHHKWKVLYSSLVKSQGDLEYNIKENFVAGITKFLTSF